MKASLLLHRKYFEYPLKFGQAMLRLEPTFTAKMLLEYIAAQALRLVTKVSEDSFEAWGVKRYGRTMYEMAFGEYSRKVWGMPTTLLHQKLAQQKLPDLNFWELVRETLSSKDAKQRILYSSYAYPQKGIGVVFDEMGEAIRHEGGQILLESEPVEIVCQDNRVVSVIVKGKNGHKHIPCSVLFNTIPLHHFVEYCGKKVNKPNLEAAQRLTYRHLMVAYLEVAKKNVTNEIMVYLLDPNFTFNRIGEQKNIAPEMAPDDRTMLSFEICTDENSKWWHMSDDEFLEVAKQDLLELGKVHPREILGGFVKRLKQAYPIYDLSFDRNLTLVLNWLERLENVYSIGRQGLFLNNDIHTSMKMGLEAARHYVCNEPRETWIESIHRYLNWRLE